jgi:predicted O-methyltransferase YrrM
MNLRIDSLSHDDLIKESKFEIHYTLESNVSEKRMLRIFIYDPFFNVRYTPGETTNEVYTNQSYWTLFHVDCDANDEKPNLKFGVRVVFKDDESGEIIYDKVHKTHHKAYEMRNVSFDNPSYKKRVWVIGDSNAWSSLGDCWYRPENLSGYLPIRVSMTSLSLNKFVDGDYISLLNSLPIQEGDCLTFMFGEIDLRYSIHNHSNKTGKNPILVCEKLMDRYYDAISNIKEKFDNRIIVLAPNPPMRDNYLEGDLLSTEEIRVACWNTFNEFWKSKTDFVEYLDWTDSYKLIDGMVDTSKLYEKNHHIEKYEEFINSFSNQLSKNNKTMIKNTDDPKELVDYCLNAELMDKCIFMQVYEEILNLSYWMKGFKPHNILEIGTMGSTFWIMSKLSTGKKVSIDIEPRESIIHHFMYGEDWRFFQGNSQTEEMFNNVKDFCPQFDFIFIDGDHTYDGVKKDFEIYKNLLSPRGVIAFHDIDPNHIFADSYAGQVYKFWEDLDEGTKTSLVCTKSSGNVKLNGVHSQGFGGIGIWRP